MARRVTALALIAGLGVSCFVPCRAAAQPADQSQPPKPAQKSGAAPAGSSSPPAPTAAQPGAPAAPPAPTPSAPVAPSEPTDDGAPPAEPAADRSPEKPAPPDVFDEELDSDDEDLESVLLLPTLTVDRSSGEFIRPTREKHRALFRYARKMDGILAEAVQDMNLSLGMTDRSDFDADRITQDALTELGEGTDWVLLPELAAERGKLRIRLTVVAPGSSVLLVRTELVSPRDLEVRLAVMVRDLVQTGRGGRGTQERNPVELTTRDRARGDGRAVLALNSAVLGGYIGYSLQRSSGSDDPRLTYPLIALGTGIGLGGSMIVADEWDVGLGDAWYLSAAMVWPTSAGVLLASGYDVREEDQFAYGLLGAAAGVSSATFALTFKGMGEGGAVLTHSGGFFGLMIGGLTQVGIDGKTDETPSRGMGYGAALGVVSAGLLATQFEISASRALLIDLGIGLGALTGAAVASPLVFSDDTGEKENRYWAGSVAAGAVAGALIAYWMTPAETQGLYDGSETRTADTLDVLPYAGVVGYSQDRQGKQHAVPGFGLQGSF
ncbi:MAG: hypothetical protein AB7K71_00995 [Polyangiaceae bacterium]